MARSLPAVLLLCLFLPLPAPAYDDCDAGFIAFLGADAYQFSPDHRGELGSVLLFSILSYQGAAATQDWGRAFWKLEVRGPAPSARAIRTARGVARIDGVRGTALVEHRWDGRDDRGRRVSPGTYRFTFRARYLPDRAGPRWHPAGYDDLAGRAEAVEAYASTDEVVVRGRDLDTRAATALRASLAATTCEVQQNAPLEAGFGYNFYYGSTHSHSNWSDGGQPTSSCSSGNAYGSGAFAPAAVYDFARDTAGLDFWVINEHNHLIENAIATNDPPVTEAKVRQRYADGLASAAAATLDGSFVALYGMEWGVTSNADQGHVTLLETPSLFGWETCTGCNGPSPECTPGTDCYFDVFTPKRFGYLTLYRRSVENPSPAGALGILCHPSSSQFDNYAFDANADQALQGIAVRSGLAFSTASDCSDTNVGSTDYSARWKDALNRGFHLGPVADHDSHCANYGVGIPNRTVYLLPGAGGLTKAALLAAHRSRHFFATEDGNAQLVFATSDGAHVMGDAFTAPGSVTLRAAVYDPGGDAVSTLEVWRGQVGAGIPTSPYQGVSGASSLSFTDTVSSGTYYYYVHAVQADGHDLWSAPMWISFGGGGGGGTGLDLSGWRIAQANASYSFDVPAGTTIPAEGYVVVARDAARAAFESFWGVSLGTNVAFVNSGGALPVINGDENYTLSNASGALVEGPTISQPSSAGQSIRRNDPCQAAGSAGSWTAGGTSTADPGSGAGAGCGAGVVINEFSDASGTGNYVYEFVELHYDASGGGDTQPPVTAITAPADGSNVSGTVAVTADASDDVGVTAVEFLLDGALQATDTAAPYSWSWDTTTTGNGSHSLTSRAHDAAGNVGTSGAVSVTVSNVSGTDVSSWRLVQASASYTFYLPAGTVIPAGGYVVVGRDASQAAFESFWGVDLGASVAYVNAAGAFPVINGSERYTLYDAAGQKIDGRTAGMSSSGGQSVQRKDPCLAAGNSSSWSFSASSAATPGVGAGAGCARGVVINEFSDALGTGNYVYEFVELHDDG